MDSPVSDSTVLSTRGMARALRMEHLVRVTAAAAVVVSGFTEHRLLVEHTMTSTNRTCLAAPEDAREMGIAEGMVEV